MFGIVVTGADLWLLAAAGACCAWIVQHRLASSRERNTRFVSASAVFRAAFTDAVLNLTEGDTPSAQVVHAFQISHLAAIQSFRNYVPRIQRAGFDKSAEHYHQCCDKCLEGGVFSLAASESTEYAITNRRALLESIRDLLSYASAT